MLTMRHRGVNNKYLLASAVPGYVEFHYVWINRDFQLWR